MEMNDDEIIEALGEYDFVFDCFYIACLALIGCVSFSKLKNEVFDNESVRIAVEGYSANIFILRHIYPFLFDNKKEFLKFAQENFNMDASAIFEKFSYFNEEHNKNYKSYN